MVMVVVILIEYSCKILELQSVTAYLFNNEKRPPHPNKALLLFYRMSWNGAWSWRMPWKLQILQALIISLVNITIMYIIHEWCISNVILPLHNNPQVHMCVFISKASNFHLSRQNVHCCINMQVTKSNTATFCTSEEHPSVFRVIL